MTTTPARSTRDGDAREVTSSTTKVVPDATREVEGVEVTLEMMLANESREANVSTKRSPSSPDTSNKENCTFGQFKSSSNVGKAKPLHSSGNVTSRMESFKRSLKKMHVSGGNTPKNDRNAGSSTRSGTKSPVAALVEKLRWAKK